MSHPTQSSILVSLPTYANITGAASVTSVSCIANQIDLGAYSARGVYLVTASSDLIFVPESDFYVLNGRTYLRKPPSQAFAAYVITACYDPAFTVPEWARTVVIENPNANSITCRKGTPNAFGYTVASYADYTGDANADGVVGFSVFIEERISFAVRPGEKWHLVSGTAAQKAIVNFY